MQEINKRVEEKEKTQKTRTGFEDFQAIMRVGGLRDGSYSDIFSVLLYKYNHDGTRATNSDNKPIEQRVTARFHIAAKTNDVWLDVRSADGTWSIGNSILIGKGHFAGVNAVYNYKDYDSRVSREKTDTRHLGKHILALLKQNNPTTEKDIHKACAKFQHADLRFKNDVLFYVKVIKIPVKDAKGDIKKGEFKTIEELHPIFKRYIKTHSVLAVMQENLDNQHYFCKWDLVCKETEKWLQNNVGHWLVMDAPVQPKTYKKKKVDAYCLNRKLPFMAKQTVRWGSPVFTDTTEKQLVTEEVIHERLKSIVVDVLGDELNLEIWFDLKCKLIRFVASQKNPKWNIMLDEDRREYLNYIAPTIKVKTPDDLFSPAALDLQGSGDTPPSALWFRLIEQFFQDFNIGLIYPDYQEPTTKAEVKIIDEEPQEVIEAVDTPLIDNSALNGQSVSPPDSIGLLSEELASTGFFDDVNDREEIRRYIVWRRGQPEFRRKLLEVYGCCTITGCISEQALEAAHIKPYRGASQFCNE